MDCKSTEASEGGFRGNPAANCRWRLEHGFHLCRFVDFFGPYEDTWSMTYATQHYLKHIYLLRQVFVWRTQTSCIGCLEHGSSMGILIQCKGVPKILIVHDISLYDWYPSQFVNWRFIIPGLRLLNIAINLDLDHPLIEGLSGPKTKLSFWVFFFVLSSRWESSCSPDPPFFLAQNPM